MRMPLLFATLATVLSCSTTSTNNAKENKSKSPILGESRAFVETPDVPRQRSTQKWVFKDAKIMTAAGDIFERGYVVVQDGLIDAVGTWFSWNLGDRIRHRGPE